MTENKHPERPGFKVIGECDGRPIYAESTGTAEEAQPAAKKKTGTKK